MFKFNTMNILLLQTFVYTLIISNNCIAEDYEYFLLDHSVLLRYKQFVRINVCVYHQASIKLSTQTMHI